MNYPHGRCECGNHPCTGEEFPYCTGPASISVLRDGKRLKLCTACGTTGDKEAKSLLAVDESLAIYQVWDAYADNILGALART